MSHQQLLLLLVGVPPTPSSLRVRVWRRLRSLGAVPVKRSAYLLPDTPERYEDFQWLAQEIERDGGDATLVRVQQVENVSPADVLRLFHEPRDQDYKHLAARYRKLLGSLDRKTAATNARVHDELARLSKDHNVPVPSTSTAPPAAPRCGVSRRPLPCAPVARNPLARSPRRRSISPSSAASVGSPARDPTSIGSRPRGSSSASSIPPRCS